VIASAAGRSNEALAGQLVQAFASMFIRRRGSEVDQPQTEVVFDRDSCVPRASI
jgi:hypothetical protein